VGLDGNFENLRIFRRRVVLERKTTVGATAFIRRQLDLFLFGREMGKIPPAMALAAWLLAAGFFGGANRR